MTITTYPDCVCCNPCVACFSDSPIAQICGTFNTLVWDLYGGFLGTATYTLKVTNPICFNLVSSSVPSGNYVWLTDCFYLQSNDHPDDAIDYGACIKLRLDCIGGMLYLATACVGSGEQAPDTFTCPPDLAAVYTLDDSEDMAIGFATNFGGFGPDFPTAGNPTCNTLVAGECEASFITNSVTLTISPGPCSSCVYDATCIPAMGAIKPVKPLPVKPVLPDQTVLRAALNQSRQKKKCGCQKNNHPRR
jgi:hypothetical protein